MPFEELKSKQSCPFFFQDYKMTYVMNMFYYDRTSIDSAKVSLPFDQSYQAHSKLLGYSKFGCHLVRLFQTLSAPYSLSLLKLLSSKN